MNPLALTYFHFIWVWARFFLVTLLLATAWVSSLSLASLGKARDAWSRLFLRFQYLLFDSFLVDPSFLNCPIEPAISPLYCPTSYFTLVLPLGWGRKTNNPWSCSFISTRPLATKEERSGIFSSPGIQIMHYFLFRMHWIALSRTVHCEDPYMHSNTTVTLKEVSYGLFPLDICFSFKAKRT